MARKKNNRNDTGAVKSRKASEAADIDAETNGGEKLAEDNSKCFHMSLLSLFTNSD